VYESVSGSVIIISQYFLDVIIYAVVSIYPKPRSMGSLVMLHDAFSSFFFFPNNVSKIAIGG